MNKKMQMVEHAYTTVPYYRNRLIEEGVSLDKILDENNWNSIPIINKNDISMKADQLISEHYLAKMITGKLIKTRTSGTTGTYLDIYWDKADYSNSLLPLWMARWKTAKIHVKDKVCLFNLTLKNNQNYLIKDNQLIISKSNLSRERLICIYNKMMEFSPKWLLLHPGIASMLCDIQEKEHLPQMTSVQYIELTGEVVLDSLKQRLTKNFNCKVRCHYGTMEVSTIGYEDEKCYQIFDSSTYVEVLDENGKEVKEGEVGKIYVTSLHNHAMPIIRYGVGDYGRMMWRGDRAHGIGVLELEKARENDWLIIPSGEKISADILLKPVEMINGTYGNIVYQFQVTQIKVDVLCLKVVLNSDVDVEDFKSFYLDNIGEDWCKQMKILFEFEEHILPDKKTGKLGWFMNLI